MSSIELHEFVPYPITKDDKPDHVCNGGCACLECAQQKGDRAFHYQARDRRRRHPGNAMAEDELVAGYGGLPPDFNLEGDPAFNGAFGRGGPMD